MHSPLEPDPAFPRIGFLYEADPTREKVPALLNINQRAGIHLDVPFTPESHEDIGRWFGREPQSCPPQLLFQDHEMDFHLFGVYVASQGRDARYQAGLGRLRADYAVEDRDRSDVEYADVETVQSEIHGLHEFMEWRLTEFDFDRPQPGETLLRVAPRSKIEIGDIEGFEVSLTPATWAGPDRPNVQAIGETTLLRTVATAPRPLDEHLLIHEAIRDLLAIVCWLPLDFTEVKVQREDAPRRALAGNAVGRAWRPLHKPDLSRGHGAEPPVDLRFGNFLDPLNFESIGVDGLRTWLSRHDELARFTDPLLAFRFAPVVTPEVGLMQASISAEALGYTQALRAGLTPDAAARESFAARLRRVVSGQPLDLDTIATDTAHWIAAAADAYNGIKHANRNLPTAPLPTLIALTLPVLLRCQLLLELGVDQTVIADFQKHQSWWGLCSAYESISGWPAPASSGTD